MSLSRLAALLRARALAWRYRGVHCGRRAAVGPGCRIRLARHATLVLEERVEIESRCDVTVEGRLWLGTGSKVGRDTVLSVCADAELVVGDQVILMPSVVLSSQGPSRLEIGDRSLLSRGCVLSARELLRVGSDCQFGEYCSLRDHDHRVGADLVNAEFDVTPLEIGARVWLGAKVTVTRKGTMGHGAVVGANSVVTHPVEPLTIVVGCPARVVRQFNA